MECGIFVATVFGVCVRVMWVLDGVPDWGG